MTSGASLRPAPSVHSRRSLRPLRSLAPRPLREDAVLLNTAYLVGNTAILTGAGFLFWVIAARRFPAADVGIATGLLSVSQLLVFLCVGGMELAVLRFLPGATGAERIELLSTSLLASGALGLLGGLAFVLLAPSLSPALAEAMAAPWALVAFVGVAGLQTASKVLDNVFTADGRSDLTFWRNNAANVARLTLIVLVPAAVGAFTVFAASALPSFLAVLLGLLLLAPRSILRLHRVAAPSLASARRMTRFSGSAHLANLFYMGPQLLLPVVVLNRLGPDPAAYLYTAWRIAGLVWALTAASAGPLLAFGATHREAYYPRLRRTMGLALGATVAVGALLLLLDRQVLGLFGAAYAEHARGFFLDLVLSSVPLGIFSAYLTTCRVFDRHREMVLAGAAFSAAAFAGYIALGAASLEAYGRVWLAVVGVAGLAGLARLVLWARASHVVR